ncbi:hypothetical protein HBI88_209490 [Parastagonospora nodorum]|nr:hypothetical protein HBH50_165610 [Parastagonospora nodorum]KAH4084780.1 hypothetical protein HBH48_163340 [Parastagonospora nodorum]KAH4221286.1 hypothetical protein HBI06_164110 [Parastagonospora nodorum]KAH4600224.1 hypothetical protein HBH82_193820 [Parastagonospora nodorum]KAH4671595.1 hypothetical protein HBH78_179570 [Parastagonospora nodorum]
MRRYQTPSAQSPRSVPGATTIAFPPSVSRQAHPCAREKRCWPVLANRAAHRTPHRQQQASRHSSTRVTSADVACMAEPSLRAQLLLPAWPMARPVENVLPSCCIDPLRSKERAACEDHSPSQRRPARDETAHAS